ncbi:MAG: osmoprotectant transport system permease protein [Planctomycetota bacterium]
MRAFLACCLIAVSLVSQDTIRIGAKRFTESVVLAELMAQVIEAHTDLEVELKTGLAGTMICWGALTTGELDIYAEYTGTGWATILGRTDKVTDPLRTFFEVRRRFRSEHDVHWLEPFGLNNTYALAIREQTAEELGIRRISDLVRHQHNLRVGFGNEFAARPDGYPGLAAAYGLKFSQMTTVEHALAYEAIEEGAIDLMDAYSTDGKLLRFELRVLEDDRQFFPPYNAAPMVRGETLRKHPEVEAALAKLAFRLTDLDAQALNYIVDAEGVSPANAATAFLEIEGLIDGVSARAAAARRAFARVRKSPPAPGSLVATRPGFFELVSTEYRRVWKLLLEHIALTMAAVLLAIFVAVPLGIAIVTRRRLQHALLAFTGLLQTIPSMALLVFLIPFFGITVWTAIAALFLYALLPIMRNTYTGISGVAPDLVDAARGMGMRPQEVMRHVQLPLAMPTIMAGIRTATVIGIGVATLATFIGAGGLGGLIMDGLSLTDTNLMLLGAIPAAALAVVADWLLGLLEAKLRSPGIS